MTQLNRIRIRPRSAWRTPWQADTLAGMLCAVAARIHGTEFLRTELIDPMLAGRPPFVLSDALPGDLLPVPALIRLRDPPDGATPKIFKQARWLRIKDFETIRSGGFPACDRLIAEREVLINDSHHHNTLARDSDASLGEGGLFTRPDIWLNHQHNSDGLLTVYFRTQDEDAKNLLLELLHELSLSGFGADVATGRGRFDIAGNPTHVPNLDIPPDGANAVIVLSTFQPAPGDPTDGFWEAFAKFSKLGPNLQVSDVRKRTLIMFRPGACFHCDPNTLFLGWALPMDIILPSATAAVLRGRNTEIVHPAFGLCVPARLYEEEMI